MKNKLLLLIKINLINSFKLHKLKNTKKRKLIPIILFALYMIVFIMFLIASYSSTLINTLNKAGMIELFIPMILIVTSAIAFLFMIYNTKTMLFESNDNDLLLSLPIKPSTILVSRLLSVYLYSFVTSSFILLPSTIVYISLVGATPIFYISMLVALFLVPVIPAIASSLVGYLLAYITSKTNLKSLFEIIYYLVFIIGYFYVFSNISNIISSITNNSEAFMKILKVAFFSIYNITLAINTNSIMPLISYIIIHAILVVSLIIVLKLTYYKILYNLKNKRSSTSFKIKEVNTKSIRKSLILKELKRFISTPIYMFNTAFIMLTLLVVAILSIFTDKTSIMQMIGMEGELSISTIILILISFTISLTNTCSASISLEGKNFWILKCSPIKIKDIFKSKLFLNYLITIPVAIISIIIFKIVDFISLNEMFILIIYSICLSLVVSNFGLLINLKFPNMDATNDAIVVKRSTSVMISILIPALIVGFGMSFLLTVQVSFNNIVLIATLILIGLFIILKILLNTYGIKRFKEIN